MSSPSDNLFPRERSFVYPSSTVGPFRPFADETDGRQTYDRPLLFPAYTKTHIEDGHQVSITDEVCIENEELCVTNREFRI